MRELLANQGFAWWPDRVAEPLLAACLLEIAEADLADAAGTRNALALPAVRALLHHLYQEPALAGLLPPGAVCLQCTLFDKPADRNWLVSLHQDLSLPVAARTEGPSLQGWAEKEGALFVQPPASYLQDVLALRVQLDDCNEDNGALRVVPTSHQHGRLMAQMASALRSVHGEVVCAGAAGSVLAMRPLLLHASSKARNPRHRRVLHYLIAPAQPPNGLQWASPMALTKEC